MIEPSSAGASYDRPPYVDRSGGLVAFGVLQILLGLACLGMIALVMVGAAFTRSAPAALPPGTQVMSLQQVASTSAIYLLAAVAFAWLGVGSILARRWARTLTLILSWAGLAMGLVALLFLLLLGPTLVQTMSAAVPGAPGGAFILGCVAIVMGVLFVLLPLGFVLFYRSPNVKATCEAKDPTLSWTDRCPAPVLALSLGLALNVLLLPLSFFSYGRAFPLFGRIVSGPPAIASLVALWLLCAFLAWAVYRLRPAAWWVTLGLWLLGFVSSAMTFRSGLNVRELYSRMGMAPQQVETTVRLYSRLLAGPGFFSMMVLFLLLAVLYLLWVRKYFFPPAA